MGMTIKRWTGTALVDVADADLSTYCRDGLYVPCSGTMGNPPQPCLHLWTYAGADPVPAPAEIKKKIKKEVPHM